MKKFLLLTLSALLFCSVGFSQSAAIRAKNAALRSALNSGQPASIQNTINYVDEVRSELGKWEVNYFINDTVTVAQFPGKTTLVSKQTLYEIDLIIDLQATNDTTTGTVKLAIDSTEISISLSAVLNPFIKIHGFVFRNGSDYHYQMLASVSNTTTNATTFIPLNGTFTKSTGNVNIDYRPVNLSEVEDTVVLSKVSLVKQ